MPTRTIANLRWRRSTLVARHVEAGRGRNLREINRDICVGGIRESNFVHTGLQLDDTIVEPCDTLQLRDESGGRNFATKRAPEGVPLLCVRSQQRRLLEQLVAWFF